MIKKIRVNSCVQLGPFYAEVDVISETPEKIIMKKWNGVLQELFFDKENLYWDSNIK